MTMAERINRLIRAGGFGLDLDETPFLCECTDSHCHAAVWLASEEFDFLREQGHPILGAGHNAQEAATDAAVVPLPGLVGSATDRRLAS
jgi:hypothetical protein